MAILNIDFPSTRLFDTVACQEVAVCLTDAWAARTVTGSKIVKATVANSGHRHLSSAGFHNKRGVEQVQYPLLIDDAQITDPVTNVITCADIVEVFPYGCIADDIITGIA